MRLYETEAADLLGLRKELADCDSKLRTRREHAHAGGQ